MHWVSEVARQTRFMYVEMELDGYVSDENLMQLNGALASWRLSMVLTST